MLKPTKLGHIVIKVRDLERSRRFYTDVMGLRQTGVIEQRMAFFAAGNDSHDLAIMAIGEEAPGPEGGRVGLNHFAYQVENESDLRDWYAHLQAHDVRIVGTTDHGVAKGIYFLDPDGNQLEVTYEVPLSEWPADRNPFAGDEPLKLD